MKKIHAPWRVYRGVLRPTYPTKIVEIHDARGDVILPWGAFDHIASQSKRFALAKFIVEAVNAAQKQTQN